MDAPLERADPISAGSKALQQAILDSANYTIISTDLKGTILSFNKAAERMLGFTAAETIGTAMLADLHDVEELQTHAGNISAQLETRIKPSFEVLVAKALLGDADENEWSYIRKDGSRLPVLLSVTALRNDDGAITGFLAVGQDITERKKIDRMKNEFISTVSHELRTPLTAIVGSLGLIRNGNAGELPDKAKSMIDIAHNNSERLVRLINEILDVEKIESGELAFHKEVVEIQPLVERAIEANLSYAAGYGVSFGLDEALPGARVEVDSDKITQVLTNLLSNAAKFAPADSKVGIAVTRVGDAIRVAIADQGPGIPADFHGQIFQKFAQADSSDSREKGGTGLGLSISKAIIDKHNGMIGFDSEPGTGTIFFFELAERGDMAVRHPAIDRQSHLLICESDPDTAMLLTLILERGGFTADVAATVEDAQEKLAIDGYAAMTLSLGLPGDGGVDLIRELRERAETRDLPIIVVSARSNDGGHDFNGDAFGVIDWLDKPINPDRLLAVLRRVIHQSAAKQLRILHIEDDPGIRTIVSTLVGDLAVVVPAAGIRETEAIIARESFDLVILDLVLPDGQGETLLPKLRGPDGTALPVIIFSAKDVSRETADSVTAALVKSRTSNETLLNTIRAHVRGYGAASVDDGPASTEAV